MISSTTAADLTQLAATHPQAEDGGAPKEIAVPLFVRLQIPRLVPEFLPGRRRTKKFDADLRLLAPSDPSWLSDVADGQMHNPCKLDVVWDHQPRATLRPIEDHTIDDRRCKLGFKLNDFVADVFPGTNTPVSSYVWNVQHSSIVAGNF